MFHFPDNSLTLCPICVQFDLDPIMPTEVQLKGSSEIRLILHPGIVENKCKASVKTHTREKAPRPDFKQQSEEGSGL